jgi:hypothetical protein
MRSTLHSCSAADTGSRKERGGADLAGRDRELQDVLDRIEASLAAIEQIRTPEQDARLAVIEAAVSPISLKSPHPIT